MTTSKGQAAGVTSASLDPPTPEEELDAAAERVGALLASAPEDVTAYTELYVYCTDLLKAVETRIGALDPGAEITPEQLDSVCILLGPYRNLTTLTSAVLGLHPQCTVLNHAGLRTLQNPRLNFLADYSDDKFREFVRYAGFAARGGERGTHGGDIRLSHAFDRRQMRDAEAKLADLPRARATCLVWKESHMVSNLLRASRVDVGRLLERNGKLRFLLPVRNPIDCAISNLRQGHVQFFAESHGLSLASPQEAVLAAVLDEIAWFLDLRDRSGSRDSFFLFFEHEMGRGVLERLLEFVRLPRDEAYLDAAAESFKAGGGRRKDEGLVRVYADLVGRKFAHHPQVRDALLKFAPSGGKPSAPEAPPIPEEIRRTAPCPCGSGKRYKDCHGALKAPAARPPGEAARELLARGNFADAARAARAAVDLDPGDADAWTVLGLALEATEPEAAVAAWQTAVAVEPGKAEAHFRVGDFRRRRGEYDAAVAAYEAAVEAGSAHPVLLNNLGLALQQRSRFADAERSYREALRHAPDLVEAHANLADLLRLQRRHPEAAERYARALSIEPGVAALWLNLGVCQHQMGDLGGARTSFERAHALAPDDPHVDLNLAAALNAAQRHGEALALIEKAASAGAAAASNLLLYTRQQLCDWRDFEALFEAQRASLGQDGAPAIPPHNMLALPYSAPELLAGARKWVAANIALAPVAAPPAPVRIDGRLRIAYLGPDFRTHPLANLLTAVIERHDRSRFEVFGYSLGPDDASPARARFAAAFDRFVDVRSESFGATAQRIRDDRIAVLFDTSGYVLHARPEIFALRPAPVQVNCIGFPGTLGAGFYDWILADSIVAPPRQQANFAERFLYLPDCYLPSDPGRVAGATPSRADCGLPDDAFVFCCFNASYKILPPVFDVWMRLLEAARGSVLWLLETSPEAKRNLRREAERRGVAAERLVFAPRVPLAEHLARQAAADLFLDTLPCNAHTTANDALFAGLPLLTCEGETFAGRVSASQLRAAGLSELVTSDLAAYEALAFALARDPQRLRACRERLRASHATAPLFDTTAYTRALERLLEEACAR